MTNLKPTQAKDVLHNKNVLHKKSFPPMDTSTSVSLSVSIVLFKPDLKVLIQVLQHLEAAWAQVENLSAHCYLINNGPELSSLPELIKDFLPNITCINNPSNTGYGAANNLAIRVSKAKYHLVLNPDAFVHQDALKAALEYLEAHPDVGLLCPRVLNPDGTQQFVHRKHPSLVDMFLRSFAPIWLKKVFKKRMQKFELRYLDWEKVQDIPSPSGCCMLFRSEVLQKIDGFDERYFLYYEDSDIGRKVAQIAGVRYFPSFKVTHLWARDSRKSWSMKWIMIKSGLFYFFKWRAWF